MVLTELLESLDITLLITSSEYVLICK